MATLQEALAVTAEVCGTEFSKPAAMVMIARLQEYPLPAVMKALDRCQTEVTGKLSLAAIVQRIDDGRPGSDEAWATAIEAHDESNTVVWTEETAKAYWAASSLLDSGDKIGARMAFRNAYEREVQNARHEGRQVKWTPTLGHDPDQREMAIMKARELNQLSDNYAKTLLPYKSNITVEDIKLKMLGND